MRVDHIEKFNSACATVLALAAAALAEHTRQIDELKAILREANALAARTGKALAAESPAVSERAPACEAESPASPVNIASSGNDERSPFAPPLDAVAIDTLRLAMRRAEEFVEPVEVVTEALSADADRTVVENSGDDTAMVGVPPPPAKQVRSLSDIAVRLVSA